MVNQVGTSLLMTSLHIFQKLKVWLYKLLLKNSQLPLQLLDKLVSLIGVYFVKRDGENQTQYSHLNSFSHQILKSRVNSQIHTQNLYNPNWSKFHQEAYSTQFGLFQIQIKL